MNPPLWLARCASFAVAISSGLSYPATMQLTKCLGLPSMTLFLEIAFAFPFAIPFLFPSTKGKSAVRQLYGSTDDCLAAVLRSPSANESKELRSLHWATVCRGVLRGSLWAAALICQVIAITFVIPNKVTLWTGLYVVLTPIGEGCLFGNLPIRYWIAAAVSFCGVLVFESSADVLSNIFSTGTMLSFMPACIYATTYLIVRNAMKANPDGALPYAAGTILGMGITASLWILFEFFTMTIQSGLGTATLVFANAFGQLGNWRVALVAVWLSWTNIAWIVFGESWLLQWIRASEHTVILGTICMWTGVASFVANGIPFTLRFAIGSFLSFVGVTITQLGDTKKESGTRESAAELERICAATPLEAV